MKKFRIAALIAGICLTVFGIGMALISAYNVLFGAGSFGIIGGADLPTFLALFRTRLSDRYLGLTGTGILLIILSVVLLIVEKRKKK